MIFLYNRINKLCKKLTILVKNPGMIYLALFIQAMELVKHAKNQLHNIQPVYQNSLNNKEIDSHLLIEIKNLMENLRSALDFTARALHQKHVKPLKSVRNIYFPYVFESHTNLDFSKRIKKCIPSLSKSRPDIVAKIDSYQHYHGENNKWLPRFMELNNENKHQQLTPQKKREFKQLRISSGSTKIIMGGKASISMGRGAKIQMGDMTIPGGQTFNADNPPITFGPGKKKVITWVSFYFSSNNEPVIPFLTKCVQRIEKIVDELAKY